MKKVWIWATLLLVLSCNDSATYTSLEELIILSQSSEVQRQVFASQKGYSLEDETSNAIMYVSEIEELHFRDNQEVVYITGLEQLYINKLKELKALGISEPQKKMTVDDKEYDVYLLSDSISVSININQQYIANELLKYVFVIRNLKSFERN